jgi:hypothetical protein
MMKIEKTEKIIVFLDQIQKNCFMLIHFLFLDLELNENTFKKTSVYTIVLTMKFVLLSNLFGLHNRIS